MAFDGERDEIMQESGIVEDVGDEDPTNLSLPPKEEEAVIRARSYVNAEIYTVDDEKLSYFKLQQHIMQNHPMNENAKSYGVCNDFGGLPCMNCCFNRKMDRVTGKENINIKRAQMQIGLGPTLMLMTTKSLSWLFFILTILNLPVYFFYYQGNVTKQENSDLSFGSYFAMLSLGNIGQSTNACGEINTAIEDDMILSCSFGNLGSLNAFGLVKSEDVECKNLTSSQNPNGQLEENCSRDSQLFKDNGRKLMAFYNQSCEGKPQC